MGQTGSRLDLRFKDHSDYATSNNPQSAHAIPNIHSAHEYGPNGNHHDLITFRIEMQTNEHIGKLLHSTNRT